MISEFDVICQDTLGFKNLFSMTFGLEGYNLLIIRSVLTLVIALF